MILLGPSRFPVPDPVEFVAVVHPGNRLRNSSVIRPSSFSLRPSPSARLLAYVTRPAKSNPQVVAPLRASVLVPVAAFGRKPVDHIPKLPKPTVAPSQTNVAMRETKAASTWNPVF
jgi:hypothetical protein